MQIPTRRPLWPVPVLELAPMDGRAGYASAQEFCRRNQRTRSFSDGCSTRHPRTGNAPILVLADESKAQMQIPTRRPLWPVPVLELAPMDGVQVTPLLKSFVDATSEPAVSPMDVALAILERATPISWFWHPGRPCVTSDRPQGGYAGVGPKSALRVEAGSLSGSFVTLLCSLMADSRRRTDERQPHPNIAQAIQLNPQPQVQSQTREASRFVSRRSPLRLWRQCVLARLCIACGRGARCSKVSTAGRPQAHFAAQLGRTR